MDVQIVEFPQTRVAAIEHRGAPELEHDTVRYLYETWLPTSGESLGNYPATFHYVNVGLAVRLEDAITDVYLPLK